MTASTARQGSRITRAIRLSAVTLLLAVTAAACSDDDADFAIDVEQERSDNGALQGLVVDGSGFTPNGTVLITLLMSATGGNDNPYVEEQIQADGSGAFRYERRPPTCPQPADYERGHWTLVVARDMTEGISGSERLTPGVEPDCTG